MDALVLRNAGFRNAAPETPAMDKPVKIPGPDHPIAIAPNPTRVAVSAAGRTIAETQSALTLREANLPPVAYIPRGDVDMMLLHPSAHRTHCPYKGDASYFDIPTLGDAGRNAAWSYEHPHAAVAEIAGHIAFYPEKVEMEEQASS
jgi:uncharacterized protein (DUF427 family)